MAAAHGAIIRRLSVSVEPLTRPPSIGSPATRTLHRSVLRRRIVRIGDTCPPVPPTSCSTRITSVAVSGAARGCLGEASPPFLTTGNPV